MRGGLFGRLWLLLRPGHRSSFTENDTQPDIASALIGDGAVALERLKKVIPTISDLAMQTEMRTLAMTTQAVLSDMRANPGRVMLMRRLFTFYLPNAVAVAEGWQMLERHANPSIARVQQSRETMRMLNETFVKYAQDADSPELEELDTTLKLLKSSLKSDMGTTS